MTEGKGPAIFNGESVNIQGGTEHECEPLQRCDVLVIGGGPAGSSISALLAEQGWHVEVLEKDTHPRFHIGESLLPDTLPFLERLGVLQEVDKIGIQKHGIELISPSHDKPVTLYFADATDRSFPYAYQVRRSEFDQVLLKNAGRKGAKVHEGCRVTEVRFRQGNTALAIAVDRDKNTCRWEASFIVDATGRDTFLSSRSGCKERDRHHNSAAIYGHFEGARRHNGIDEGNISIHWFEHGWVWMIPFKDGVTSVGAVCWPSYLKSRKVGLDQFLWDTLAMCPPVSQRLRDAKLIMPVMAAANYSYQSRQMTGPNYIMIGDAFAFIDPVFSSGVHLALKSAILGASVVDAHLRGSPDLPHLKKAFERTVRRGLDTYSWFIYRFMQPAFRNLFMSPRNMFGIEGAVLSLLAGDVFRRTPSRMPIFLFKALYYGSTLLSPLTNLATYRRIRQAVHDGDG